MKPIYLWLLFILGIIATTVHNKVSINGDMPEFLVAIKNGGLPHPPGYSTYLILAKCFISLAPEDYMPMMLNAFSFVAIIGLVFLFMKFKEGKADTKTLVLCAGVLVTSRDIWQHAVIGEVYLPTLFILSLIFYLSQQYKDGKGPKFLYAAVFFGGLSVGVHHLSLFVAPLFLIFLLKNLKQLNLKNWLCVAALFIAGLSTNLIPLIKVNSFYPMNTYAPDNFERYSKYVRGIYDNPNVNNYGEKIGNLTNLNFLNQKKDIFVSFVSNYLIPQFSIGFWFCFLYLFAISVMRKQKTAKRVVVRNFLIFSYLSFGLLYFVSGDPGSSTENEVSVHLLAAYAFLVFSFVELFEFVENYRTKIIIWIILSISTFHQIMSQYNYINRNFSIGEIRGKEILQSVSNGGVLFVHGDNDEHTALYQQYVRGFRQDVLVVNLYSLNNMWYIQNLRKMRPELNISAPAKSLAMDLVNQNSSKVNFFVSSNDSILLFKLKNFYPYKGIYKWMPSSSVLTEKEIVEMGLHQTLLFETKNEKPNLREINVYWRSLYWYLDMGFFLENLGKKTQAHEFYYKGIMFLQNFPENFENLKENYRERFQETL